MSEKTTGFFKSFRWISIALIAMLVLAVPSCEIGLGSAVDTESPTISISSPDQSSIIREDFKISGVCKDDVLVDHIAVVIKNTDNGTIYNPADIIPSAPLGKKLEQEWEFQANYKQEDGTWFLPDGNYTFSFTAWDAASRKSGEMIRSIVIDNTAPLLVLTRPSASDTYGQKFDITGQVADDNNIDLMLVDVYAYDPVTKERGNKLTANPIELKNVPPTIDLTAAVYGDENYKAIYGDDKEAGNLNFCCDITVFDAARKFPAVEGDNGNSSNFYYMYNDIYTDLLSKYKMTQLYHMQSRALSYEDVPKAEQEAAVALLAKEVGAEGSIRSNTSAFTLNPLNNPTYEVIGYKPVTSFTALKRGSEFKISNGSQVTVKVSSGLDKTPIMNDTIGIKAFRVQQKGEDGWEPAELDADGKPVTYTIFPAYKDKDGNVLLTDSTAVAERAAAIKEVGSYDRTITINVISDENSGLIVGETYLFDVTAYDQNKNDIFNVDGNFGFFMASSGVAATLTINEPSANTLYINNDAETKLTFKGSTFHEEGKPTLKLNVKQYETGYSADFEIPEANLIQEGLAYNFTYELKPADFIPADKLSVSAQYDFSIVASYSGIDSSPINKTVMYDIGLPEINITNLTPVADTTVADAINGKQYNVNGEITIRGSFNDEDTAIDSDTMKYKYKKADGTWCEPKDVTKQQNFSVKIDTTELADKADLEVIFMVKDKAGNEKQETVYYEGTTKYFVDQSTDNPIVAVQDFKEKDEQGNTEPYKGFNTTTQSSKMTGQITDDDGIKKITIQCLTKDSGYTSNFVSDSVTYPVTPINITNPAEYKNAKYQYNLSQDLPSMKGNYKLVFDVEDIYGTTTKWSCLVRISGNAPEISDITKDRTHLAVSTNGVKEVVVTGNISGEHTAANPLTLFAAKSLDENGVPENKVKVWEVTDPSYTSGDTVSWTHTFSMTDAAFPLNTKADGSAVTDGNVKIYLQAEDSAGIASAVKEFVFTADDILPVVNTLSTAKNAAGYITAASSPFSTTFTDVSGVTEYFWQIKATAPAAVNSYADLTEANGWTVANAGTTNTFYGSFKEKGSDGNGLEEGEYNVYVIAVDKAQNVSVPKAEPFKVDLKAPVITITNTAETAKAAFALSGKVEDTYGFGTVATVSVKESGQDDPVDLSVSSVDGTWTSNAGAFPTSGADGIYTYTVSAKDAAGNPATPVSYSVTFDKSAPTVEILTPASDTTWLNAPTETTVSGRVSDGTGVGVDKVYYKLDTTATKPTADDPTTEGWTLIGSDANWNIPVATGSEGEAVKTIWVCAKDKLGNMCMPVSRKINVDTATPVITLKKVEDVSGTARELTVNSGTYYSKGNFRITVEATDTNLDTVKCNNAATTDAGSNLYTFEGTASGDYEFVVTDKASKTKTVSVNVKVDGTKPVVSALTSSDKNTNGYITSTPSPFTVAYSDNDGNEGVELYWQISTSVPGAATYASKAALTASGSGWTKVNGDTFYGNFKEKGSAGNGLEEATGYKAYVVAVDRADNVSVLKDLAFGVDLKAPVVTITNNADIVKAQFALSGTVTDSIGNGSVAKVTVSESGQATAKEFVVSNGEWTSGATKFPTANTDGTYTYTVSATDAAGNTAAVKTYTVKFDNTAPSVSISKPTDGEWIAGDGTADVTVIGTAMDGSGVGVEKVYYMVGATATTPSAADPTTEDWTLAGGTSENWTFTVVPGGEGKAKKTVWIFAEDKLGNRTATPVKREINVDNAAPTVTNAKVYYVNGGTSTQITAKNGTYYVKGNFNITVEASDTNALKATDPVTCDGTAISGTSGTYTYNGTATGNYEFKATDIAGKESTVLKVNVTVDSEDPTSELTVTNLIEDFAGHVNEHVVNGEVTIKGTSNDNDRVDSVSLKIYQGTESGTLKCSVDSSSITSDANITGTSTKLLTAGAGNKNEAFTFKMDSTKLATGKYTIVYEVKDRTGNEAVKKTQTIYVDQASDIPLLNFEDETDVTVTTTAAVNAGGNGKNLLGTDDGNRKIKFSASDDDGAPTVKVWSRKWDTTKTAEQQTAWTTDPQQTFTSGSFSYVIPKNAENQVEEGFYQVKAEIRDKYNLAGTSYTFMVGVSSGAPVVSISKNELTFVKGTSSPNAEGVSIAVKYKGGTNLTRTVAIASGEPTNTGFTNVSGTFSAPAPTASLQTYTDTVKAYCSENKSVKVTVTYTAQNMFNETGSASYTYLIDNVKPVINEYETGKKYKVNGNEYADDKWNQDNKFEFYAGWKDAGSTDTADEMGYTHSSEVTTIKYWFTETDSAPTGDERGTFAPSKNGAVYELNNRTIQGFEEGINYLWFKAVDGAGNESANFEKLIIKVDSAAPIVTLDKTGNVYVKPDTADATKIKNIVITGKLVDQNITDENARDLRKAQGKSSGLNSYHPIRVFKGSIPDAWPGDAKKDYLDYRTSYETDADWELIKPFVRDETRVAVNATYHYKNEIAILESEVNEDGTFSVTIPEMTEAGAPYDIFVVGSDYKDNHGKVQFKLLVDNVPPTVSIGGPKGRIGQSAVKESENPVTIFGSASDADSKVKEVFYQIRTDNTVPTHETDGWESAGTTEAWSKTLAAAQPQGKYKLYVYAEDNAGNKSAVSDATEYHIDYADPVVKIKVNGNAEVTYEASNLNVAQDVITNADNFKFKYSITDTYGIDTTASALEIKKDGVTIPKGNTNGWSVDASGDVKLNGTYLSDEKAKDGTYEFTVTAVDLVGKKTEVKRIVKLDTEGPVVTITAPSTGTNVWQTSGQIKFVGTVEDSSAVSAVWYKAAATSGSVSVPSSGDKKADATWTNAGWAKGTLSGGSGWNYSPASALNHGTTYVNFAAVDEHGNVSECFNNQVNVDTDIPTLIVTTDGTNEITSVVQNTQITLKMVPADQHLDYVGISGTDVTNDTGKTYKTIPSTADGYVFNVPTTEKEYTYTVVAKDKGGREVTKTVSVIFDQTAPVIADTTKYVTSETKNNTTKTAFTTDWTNATKMTIIPDASDTLSKIASADFFVSEYSYRMSNTDAGTNDLISSSGTDNLWTSISVKNGTVVNQDYVFSGNTDKDKLQYVYLRVTDNAGNTAYKKSAGYKIDTEAPSEATLVKVDGEDYAGRKLANGDSNVVFTVKPADSKSGVASVQVLYKGTPKGDEVTTNSSGVFSLTVNKDDIKASGENHESSVQIGVRVKDKAGNTSDHNLFNITIDTTPPTGLEISTIPDASTEKGNQVNKAITIKGSANDDQNLASVKLQYMVKAQSGDTWVYPNPETWVDVPTTGSYNWSATIDTLAKDSGKYIFADKQAFKIRIVAEDAAGNEAESTPVELSVDQDTDIPVITIDGIKVDGNAYVQQANGKITGSIDDDDGNINLANDGTTEGKTDNYMLISTDNGSTWNKVTSLGTTRWTYDLGSDGSKTVYFKVKDQAGNEFTKDSTQKIIIKGDNGTTADKLVCTVDTSDPTADVKIFKGTTELQNQSDYKFSQPVDTNLILKITATDASGIEKIEAYFDAANKVTKASVTSGTPVTIEVPLPSDATQSVKTLTYKVYDKSGQGDDNSARITTNSYPITVDNVKPSLSVSQPSSTLSIAGDTTVTGTTSDGTGGSGVSSVRWFIPSNQQVEAWAVTGEAAMTDAAKDALFTNTIEGTYTWAIEFNADSAAGKLQDYYSERKDEAGIVTGWNNYPVGGSEATTYGTLVSGSTALYDLPIYFRIEDAVGNVAYHTSYTVRVNPDGDRPIATILYPTLKEDGTPDTVSGSIRISGDASDEVDEVTEIHIQIQKSKDNNNNTEDSGWEIVTGCDDIPATGTYKWNYTFNSSDSKFDPVNSGTQTYLRFKAWAKDAKGLIGDESAWTVIKTDKDNPLIGKTNPLRIVKYEDNDANKKQLSSVEYEEGMYVSGTVFLEFSVEDASGLSAITASGNSMVKSIDFVLNDGDDDTPDTVVTTVTPDTGDSHTNQPLVSTGYYGYKKARIKIETTGSGTGLNFTIIARENKDDTEALSTRREIKLRYDNTAPTLESLKHGGDEVGLDEGKVTVKQSDGTYALKSVIDENDSGLAQMFMFWTRTVSGTTNKRVYDPRKKSNNVFYAYTDTGITKTIDFNADGLPYRRYTGDTILTETTTTSTFTLNAADPFLTDANYVLIDGTYRQITGINAAGTTYTFNPATETAPTTVDAIYAIAIDNQRTETADGSSDDGDGIWESLVDAGTTYGWEMNFNSHNIPDGPISISCRAIDEAGNISELQETVTKIENNAPRMTKVFLGTDLNHNNKFEANEYSLYSWFTEHTSGTYSYGDPKQKKEVTTNGFKVKKDLSIVPEFVGGVGDIYMVVNTSATNTNETTKTTKADGSDNLISAENVTSDADFDELTSGNKSVDEYNKQYGTSESKINSTFRKYNITNADLVGAPSPSTEGTGKKVSFTFWDSTEELEPGSTTQSAVLYIPDFEYDMIDDVKPTAIVKPFKWVSKDDNSLYSNSTANGHIELEDDLSGGTWGSDYTDGAPKVSGKVVFRGTAYDNVGLSELRIKFGDAGNTFIGTYNNDSKKWSIKIKVDGIGTFDKANGGSFTEKDSTLQRPDMWHFAIHDKIATGDKNFTSDDVFYNQNGHQVAWEFAVDTETLVSEIAKKNVVFQIIAKDSSGLETSTDAADVGVDKNNVPEYPVDVVPYITKVTTRMANKDKSIVGSYSRTSSGKYIVASDETGITLSGFNLTGGKVIFNKESTENTAANYQSTLSNDLKFSIASKARTGAFKVVVNNVDSINNTNNNNAAGGSGKTISDTSSYSDMTNYAYNRCPNNISNNLLTDDLWFDIWELNTDSATSGAALKDPVMHINPKTDQIGFGFVKGADSVSFPGNDKSYLWYQKNRKDYKGTNFVYDSEGVAHNVSIGLDAQFDTGVAGRMLYNNSNWYAGNNGATKVKQWDMRYSISLESIGIPNGVYVKGKLNNIANGLGLIDTDRFATPSIAAARHADGTAVYIMYYDSDHDQIRFRYGQVPNTGADRTDTQYGLLNDSKSEIQRCTSGNTNNRETYKIHSDTADQNGTWQTHGMFEAHKDYYALVTGDYYNQYSDDNTLSNGETSNTKCTTGVFAGDNKTRYYAPTSNVKVQTGNKGSAYYGLDVVPGTAIGDDKVVMIWYDETTQNLMYMYREKLTAAGDNTDASSDGVANKWSKPVALVEDTLLQDCVIKVDSKGGIHIAYYDQTNADLIYGYMSGYNKASEFTTCVVDAYSQVGNRLSIDTAVHATNEKVVPYISYFSDGLSSMPKMAYLPNGVSSAADVVDGANPDTTLFTGDWEVTLIPTASVLQPYNVGIGVWKDADTGVIKTPSKGTDVATSTTERSRYANGTSELVVGYSTKKSGIGYMETAMRR